MRYAQRNRCFFLISENPAFGKLLKECGHTCPLGQFAEVTYDGGTANAGPAIRINAAAGRFRFYGLVALYIPAQTGIALVLYNGETLAGIGTVIDTFIVSLVPGDVLRIESDLNSITTYRVKINGATVISVTLNESQISPLNSCVGFVGVFDVPDGLFPPPEEDEGMLIVKPANENRSNTTTLADDSDLKVAIGANETWHIRAVIIMTAASGLPDIEFTFNGPAGSSGYWIERATFFTNLALGVPFATGLSPSEFIVVYDALCVNGGTPGTFAFQWAQDVLHADATTIKANSYLIATKKP